MPREILFPETRKSILLSIPRITSRHWLLLAFFIAAAFNIQAQSRTFIHQYRPLSDSLAAEYGIPVAIILGISIIESSSGTSRNCKLLNNFFGMEGKNDLKKTRGIKTRYKQYPDARSSFVDFCRLMSRKKFYKKLKGNKNDRLWVDAISKSGYSEAPELWKQRVSTTIRKHKLSVIH
jgi:Bax protein